MLSTLAQVIYSKVTMTRKIIYILAGAVALFSVFYLAVVPDVRALRKKNPGKTSLMEYREREWKKAGKKRQAFQVWTPISSMSPYLVKAVIIAEDDKFYSHEGFDYEAIQEAMEKNIKSGRFRAGGSTITQQLAKNLYLTPEKSFLRKFKEALITWRLERALTKRRILEIYLNVAEWGEGVFGAEAASLAYFGKSSSELTPMEASRLVVVLPSPRRYNPVSEQGYVQKRTEIVYNIMVRRGIVIPEFEEVTAAAQESAESPSASPSTDMSAPLSGSASP